MNKTYITIALLSPLACTAAMGARKAKASNQQKPNVIIILADDLGYGDLGCYGARNVETPNVDKLAKQGIRFTDAHAIASTSTPSRYSLLTGEYAWRKPGTDVAPGDAGMIIKPTQFTMADMFKSVGYSTCAIGKWHLGLGAETGKQDWNAPLPSALADIGFDHHYIMAATADRVPCVFIEDGKVANYDPSAPIEVSYYRNFPGEPTGKDNPELCYNMKSSHGHNMSIVNGIGRIGYMKGGRQGFVERREHRRFHHQPCHRLHQEEQQQSFLPLFCHQRCTRASFPTRAFPWKEQHGYAWRRHRAVRLVGG